MAKTPNGEMLNRALLFVARHRGAEFGEPDGATAAEIVAAMDLTGEEAGRKQARSVYDGMLQIPLLAQGEDDLYRITPEGAERIAPHLLAPYFDAEEGI
jgi:hypothetical protein